MGDLAAYGTVQAALLMREAVRTLPDGDLRLKTGCTLGPASP